MKLQLCKFGTSLVSRELAKQIAASLCSQGVIIYLQIDFDGVKSVGTSFSHELLVNIIDGNKSIKKIDFLNANKSTEFQLKKALASIQEENKISDN